MTNTADRAVLDVYDVDTTTHLGTVGAYKGLVWQEINSQAGRCSFSVPLDDAATSLLTPGRYVQISWRGDARFRCRIEGDHDVRTRNGREWLDFQEQPGAFAALGNALVYPEYPLSRATGSQRWFGFMSRAAAWYVSANWNAPAGAIQWSTDIGVRRGMPPEFRDDDPYWIGAEDPYTTLADGTTRWYRCEFTTTDAKSLRLLFTADDLLTLYLDGEQIFTPDQAQGFSWRHAYTYDAQIQAGDHVLAAKVQNAPLVPGHTNPVTFALVAQEMDSAGAKSGVLLKTDATNWKVCTVEPGWAKGQVIEHLYDEGGENRGAIPFLGEGYDDFHDHDGNAWTDVGEYAFPLGSTTVADVVTQLSESTIDSAVSPIGTLILWQRRGSDKSATLELKRAVDGGNLLEYEVDQDAPRVTAALSQLQDGTWIETPDTGAISTYGRFEVGLAAGGTGSKATQEANVQAQLDESAHPHIQFQARVSPGFGPQVYTDFNLGDSVKAPGHRGGAATKVRLLQVTVDLSAKLPAITLGLVEDLS